MGRAINPPVMEIQQEYMERYDGARTWNSIVDSRCKQEMLQFRSQVQELFATFEKEFHNMLQVRR
jgi:hypothetical protein